MEQYILSLAANPLAVLIAFGVLGAVCLILFIWNICLTSRQGKIADEVEEFMGSDFAGLNLEKMFVDFIKQSRTVDKQEQEILTKMSEVEERLTYIIQRVGVVRYNPFPEIDGDMSFSIALLDNTYSGFVITGIYTRQGSFIYLKPVRKGKGEKKDSRYRLSKEEMDAVDRAIASH